MTTATNNTPPSIVKSHFVWKANIVNAMQTAAVMPMANRTFEEEKEKFLNFFFVFSYWTHWQNSSAIKTLLLIKKKKKNWRLTSSGSNRIVDAPTRYVSANVNMLNTIILVGDVRRTLSTHTMAIKAPNTTIIATNRRTTLFWTSSWVFFSYLTRRMKAKVTNSWSWKAKCFYVKKSDTRRVSTSFRECSNSKNVNDQQNVHPISLTDRME